MMRVGLVTLLVAALSSAASAQTYYYPAQSAPAYYQPTNPYAVPNYPFGGRFPRARRGLEVIADPTLLVSRGSPFYTGQRPTPYPIFDAAPNIVNLASIGAISSSSSAITALAFGLPPAIRLTRVVVLGPPAYAHDRRETLLWVLEPTLLHVYQARQVRRGTYPYYYPGR